MPQREMESATSQALSCDLMLVLGSSLVVNPAASLIGLAIEAGADVIIINKGETPYDNYVTLKLTEGIGELLPPAVEIVKQNLARR
jgi:NAD-dependent deacetylase